MARYRFGTFDFDSDARELRRDGFPVRLQAQPAQVLAILLENCSQIVTRETLQQRVWADGTQVDFERGLNYCIAQVRSALGDSADSPRFVRTIPKRGYQFLAPVEQVNGTSGAIEAGKPKRTLGRFGLPAAVALVVLAGLASFWIMGRGDPHIPIVAVCLFDNETGEVGFDQIASGFSDAMTAELTASGSSRVQVIGNADLLRAPRSQRDFGKIHMTLGANYVVIGQIQRDSRETRVLAHLLRMPKQTHVDVQRLDGIAQLDSPLEIEKQFAERTAKRFLEAIRNDSHNLPEH